VIFLTHRVCHWCRRRVGDAPFFFYNNNTQISSYSLVPVPYQDNGCDCGVFVCRYAYNLYMMRHKQFTWASYENEMPSFASLITRGPAIQFDMYDIGRIRDEISALIDKLSKLYLPCLEVLDLTGKSTCQDRLQTDGLESPESRAEQKC
jgi:hypothetical protein